MFKVSRRSSLRTRVTVLSLTIFVCSITAMMLWSNYSLRQDLEQLQEERQLSTASIFAAGINQALEDRLYALDQVANRITPALVRHPAQLQAFLEDEQGAQTLFNTGLFVADMGGTVTASVPTSANRLGLNLGDRDYLQTALHQGRQAVSAPLQGRGTRAPLIALVVPIRDGAGQVIGALAGITGLLESNFLDRVLHLPKADKGSFLLVDALHRRVVSASDKRRVLEYLPDPGERPLLDRYQSGYEGYGTDTDAQGVAYLSAARRIAAAPWYVVSYLPASEAFATFDAVQHRRLAAAVAMMALTGLLLWWQLRRALAPLLASAQQLAALSASTSFPDALPIARRDEVGQLVHGVNGLLEALQQRENARLESDLRYRKLVDWTPEAIAVQAEGTLVFVNQAAVRLVQAGSAEELLGRSILDFIHPKHHALAQLRRSALGSAPNQALEAEEYCLLTVLGQEIEVEVRSCAIPFNRQAAILMGMRDVSARNRVEERLRKLSRITEQAPIAIAITDLQGNVEYVNPQLCKATGYAAEDILGHNPRIFQSGLTPPATYDALWQALQKGQVWRGEFYNHKKDGQLFIEQAVVAPVLDAQGHATHYVALKEDITERKEQHERLERLMTEQHTALKEKTALLHEVHHRVKNNLQVITSLLRLEARRAGANAGDTRGVFTTMQGRIRTMALMHETLYRSGSFAAVELHHYIRQVATLALRAQANDAVRLVLELSPVRVSLDQATPCGLLVNELLCNSLKHAFAPGSKGGSVRVALHALEGSLWCLQVDDNGSGLPADFAQRRSDSLGLQLVSDLVGQLHGSLEVHSDQGSQFSVRFPLDDPTATAAAAAAAA